MGQTVDNPAPISEQRVLDRRPGRRRWRRRGASQDEQTARERDAYWDRELEKRHSVEEQR